MPSLTRNIPHRSDQANKILTELRVRIKMSERKLSAKYKEWQEAEDDAQAYMPETEMDRLRKVKRDNGQPEYTTILVPHSYAVVMTAHTYITSVFLGRSPVFQYTGRHGESQQKVQAMEALVDYQMMVGGWLPPLYIWLHDVLKYGTGIVSWYWEERDEQISTIQSQPELDWLGQPTGKVTKVQVATKQRVYTGHKLYNVQPWDFFWDVRVPAWKFQSGEYVGLRFALSWNECKRREIQGFYMNLEHVGKDSGTAGLWQASTALERTESSGSNDLPFEQGGFSRAHPAMVKGYEVYIEIIPKDWGLSESSYPEKWVFTCTSDFGTLIGAQPLGLLHSKFPISVLSAEAEGYGLMTRGLYKTLEPVQETINWLINSHFYNVRATLNNQMVVDPSRIVMKDLLNPRPGKVIRLKPSAYGTDPKLAFSQMQTVDVTQNHLRDFSTMVGVGERLVGVNDQIMGMLATGGRRTATEVRTSTSLGVNRLKTTAEWFSAQGWDPMSSMMVQGTQQFYDMEMQFKVAGDLLASAGQQFMMVTPELVSGFYDYVPVDGSQPIDRFAQATLWTQLMAQIRNFPPIMARYDLGQIFEWVAQLSGLKNVTQFRLQVGSPEQLQQAAAMGNVVPIAKGGGGPPAPGATSPGADKQMPGLGVPG